MAIVVTLDSALSATGAGFDDLASEIGIAEVNLSRIKEGRLCAIRFSTLNALCKTLGCQPGDVLKYIEDEEPPFCPRNNYLMP